MQYYENLHQKRFQLMIVNCSFFLLNNIKRYLKIF